MTTWGPHNNWGNNGDPLPNGGFAEDVAEQRRRLAEARKIKDAEESHHKREQSLTGPTVDPR